MKNFYKRILIMFVMVLTIMSVGIIKNEIVANAATVGEQLLLPEEGWRRYDDTDDRIIYSDLNTGDYSGHVISQPSSNGTYTQFTKGTCQFNFKGSKIRIIGLRSFHGSYNGYSDKIKVEIDNMPVEFYSNVGSVQFQTILYENTNLSDSEHCVKISNEDVLINTSINIDCIDVDGYLIGDKDTSISLDKSSLTIEENNTKKLTATTTPSAVGLEWSSSNEAIATVDQNGKVTGLKEGTCIVTVQIKGTDVKAICEVTVTKEDIVEPEEPSGDGRSLCIEMVDGNIKQAQNLNTSDFIKWYQNRDLDKTEKPFYKITNAKGNVEYLIHDKIVAFEIR